MKKYKLLKDLPYIKAGTEYIKADGFVTDKCSYVPDITGMKHERFALHADWVENNPEWFEEVKENGYEILEIQVQDEVITLYSKTKNGFLPTNGTPQSFFFTEESLLKQSGSKITKVRRLPDVEVFCVGDTVRFKSTPSNPSWVIDHFFLREDGAMLARDIYCNNVELVDADLTKVTPPKPEPKLYTQSELEEAEQKAFEAARQIVEYTYARGIPFRQHQFPTYQDYKNSKK